MFTPEKIFDQLCYTSKFSLLPAPVDLIQKFVLGKGKRIESKVYSLNLEIKAQQQQEPNPIDNLINTPAMYTFLMRWNVAGCWSSSLKNVNKKKKKMLYLTRVRDA